MTVIVEELSGGVPGDLTGGSMATAAPVPATFRSAHAVTVVGLLQLGVLLVMLVRSKVLAMLLQPEGLGIVSTVDQLVQFVAQLSALSLIPTPTRFVARAVNDGLAAVNAMYSALLKLLLVSTVGGAALAITFIYLQPRALGAGLYDYRSVAVIAILSAPLFALSGYFSNVSAAVKGYSTTSVYLFLSAVAALAAAFIGIHWSGVRGLYYANLIAGAISVAAIATYLRVSVPLKFDWKASRLNETIRRHPDIVAYCSASYVLSFAQPLSFLIVRSITLQRLGASQTGYFQAAFTISSAASLILMQGIRVYLEPIVNKAVEDAKKIGEANEFQRMFAVLMLMGTLPLVLFPRNFIAVLFTQAFTPVSAFVFVFVVAECLFLTNQVYATVLMAVDDFKGFLHAQLAGHIALCIGVWLMSGRFGLGGVAWSFVMSRLVVFVLIQRLLVTRHRLTMASPTARVIAYALAAVLGVGVAFGSAPVVTATGIAARLCMYGFITLGTVAFLRKDERAWLSSLWPKVRRS